jgi:hypothetical protein
LFFIACSPYKFRTRTLVDPATQEKISVTIPKGFLSQKQGTDTLGNTTWAFKYKGGAQFHFQVIRVTPDEWVDTARHVPQIHPDGAVMYKWFEEVTEVYHRDVRLKNYRFGYMNVSWRREIRFDSAVNHIRDQSFKR